MKKFLALALILTLALSISVFAGRVVGEEGNDPTYNNGWTDAQFDDAGVTNNDTTIAITANAGGIQHRYAVDMEYTALSITVTGNEMIWNVEEFRYDMTTTGGAPSNTTSTVTFTNRSDLPVAVSYTVDDGVGEDLLTVACTARDGKTDLLAATAGMTFGTAPKVYFDLAVIVADGKNWDDVATFYANYFSQQSKTEETIATITFTLSK